MRKLLLAAVLIFSACAPSESAIQTAFVETEASYTSTPSPTSTLTFTPTFTHTPTVTPTPENTLTPEPKSYIEEYVSYLDQWLDGYKAWRETARKLSAGEAKITDADYQKEVQSILSDMYRAAKSMEDLPLLSPEFGYYQEKAKELRVNTAGWSTLYLPGLLGNEIAFQGSLSAFRKATDNFNDISNKLISDGFVTVEE